MRNSYCLPDAPPRVIASILVVLGNLATRRLADTVVRVEPAATITAGLLQRLRAWRGGRRWARVADDAFGPDVRLLDGELVVLELTELARRLVPLGIPLPTRAGLI